MSTPYETNAGELAAQYLKADPEDIHASWVRFLPELPCRILDVGTGSGRDAAWLAKKGHEVTAMDPSPGMLEFARRHFETCSPPLHIDLRQDALPDLKSFRDEQGEYGLILVNAIWMHLTRDSRARALRKLANLLRPGGRPIITLRHGPSPDNRIMHPVNLEELEVMARRHALQVLHTEPTTDSLGRPGVSWMTVVLALPDDGTGALPLLRHIVVNDQKTATYKMVLLKAILHIAQHSDGMVLREQGKAVLPFGLVALSWLRLLYRPVNEQGMRQIGKGQNMSADAFALLHSQTDLTIDDLEIGRQFTGDRGAALFSALRRARDHIAKMPARFITYPGMNDTTPGSQVFISKKHTARIQESEWTLDAPILSSFGTLTVPIHIWDAMIRYGCWLEPAIDQEWVAKMVEFNGKDRFPLDNYYNAIRWEDPVRAQQRMRPIIERAMSRRTLHCVWSGKRLHNIHRVAVDHLFPFARWPNNDLWNLLPANPEVNCSKSDRLITADTLFQARERIVTWWNIVHEDATDGPFFFPEASASLPGSGNPFANFDEVMEGVAQQRVRLKLHQQLPEWSAPQRSR